jgi:acyl carrier protein
VRARGREALAADREAVKRRAAEIAPDDLATLIYTSGTTGDPKGVMLTHANIVSNVHGALAAFGDFGPGDVALSFLPLCHIFERMGGHYLMLQQGVTIAYAESVEKVPANLTEVRPTIMLSVPRLYEKIYARINEKVAADSPLKQRIFRWALGVGRRAFQARIELRTPGALLRAQHALADRLVFATIRERTGGRMRLFVSGGAPLAREISEFFGAVGLIILEMTGLAADVDVIIDSAVVGVPIGSEERVHAVLVLEPGTDADSVVRQANTQLDDHQKIRRALVWPEPELPRTEGTRKLKRAAIRDWVKSGGAAPRLVQQGTDALAALVAKYAGRENLSPQTTLEELGLSSLDRVQLMLDLEEQFDVSIDESLLTGARTVSAVSEITPIQPDAEFPAWNRSRLARWIRNFSLTTWILPIGRIFGHVHAEGLENLAGLEPPVIFAPNHQSHMDIPILLVALRLGHGRRQGDHLTDEEAPVGVGARRNGDAWIAGRGAGTLGRRCRGFRGCRAFRDRRDRAGRHNRACRRGAGIGSGLARGWGRHRAGRPTIGGAYGAWPAEPGTNRHGRTEQGGRGQSPQRAAHDFAHARPWHVLPPRDATRRKLVRHFKN